MQTSRRRPRHTVAEAEHTYATRRRAGLLTAGVLLLVLLSCSSHRARASTGRSPDPNSGHTKVLEAHLPLASVDSLVVRVLLHGEGGNRRYVNKYLPRFHLQQDTLRDSILAVADSLFARRFVHSIHPQPSTPLRFTKGCGDSERRYLIVDVYAGSRAPFRFYFDMKFGFRFAEVQVLGQVLTYTVADDFQDSLLQLLAEAIDTGCYGYSECTGYCFSFAAPPLVAFLTKRDSVTAEKQTMDRLRQIRPLLQHVNGFAPAALGRIERPSRHDASVDDSASAHLRRLVVDLKAQCESVGLTAIWDTISLQYRIAPADSEQPGEKRTGH